jgi:glycosyltransferase involved in cell wall biosynthesis
MRNIYVVCFTGNSGLTDYSVSLCRELNGSIDATLVTARSYDPDKYRVDFPSLRLFRRTRYYPVDILRFAFHVLRHRPDVVLWQSWLKSPLLEGWIVKLFKRSGIRTALSIHDLLPHYPGPFSRLMHAWFYRTFDALIVHSRRAAEGLVRLGVHTRPLIVPHGVYDIFKLDQLTKDDVLPLFPEVDKDDFVVLFFGNIETRKGILEFLEASDILAAKRNIKFVVAGRNDLGTRNVAAKTFNSYRGRDNVVLHDSSIPFDKVQHYFYLADVVALPYLEGTTSGVMKLAMAFGKPVIASDVGDFSETLKDWSGIVLGPGAVAEEFASGLERVHRDYDRYMSRIESVKSKYSWSEIGNQYLEYLLPEREKVQTRLHTA